MRKPLALFLGIMLIAAGCTPAQDGDPPSSGASSQQERSFVEPAPGPSAAASGGKGLSVQPFAPYSDLRSVLFDPQADSLVLSPDRYRPEDIYTYSFNERTVFQGSEALQQQVLENGKNPGLGVRLLHEEGITGRGVSVAIIDQPLILEPPEYADRIAAYYECGYADWGRAGSMHGSAVTSILAGGTTGVAPEATVYYAAAPSWTLDATYFANGLDWIVGLNETLPEAQKIRVVSVSTSLSGEGSEFSAESQPLWDAAVARAQAANILVIDCKHNSAGSDSSFVEQGYYDPLDPDNIESARAGKSIYGSNAPTAEGRLAVPCDFRTTVEQYDEGDYSFRYGGAGGLSWGVPYAAGVAALGWQVNPALTAEEVRLLLLESAYLNEYDERIIHPAAFIEAVKATL